MAVILSKFTVLCISFYFVVYPFKSNYFCFIIETFIIMLEYS